MNEDNARTIAKILGGDVWDSGGGIWLVIRRRLDGKVAAMSDESVCIYENEEDLHSGQPSESVVIV